jgi:hypothetical protein
MASAREKNSTQSSRKCSGAIRQLKAGSEVGWIFTDGQAVAIERHEGDSDNDEERDS